MQPSKCQVPGLSLLGDFLKQRIEHCHRHSRPESGFFCQSSCLKKTTCQTQLDQAYFGPSMTQGGGVDLPTSLFLFFFWTPGRRDLLKKWAHNLVFAKIFNLGPTFDISVNLFPTYSYLKKSFFFLITFRRLESTLAPFVGVPPYESKAFLTNSVILWQKKT